KRFFGSPITRATREPARPPDPGGKSLGTRPALRGTTFVQEYSWSNPARQGKTMVLGGYDVNSRPGLPGTARSGAPRSEPGRTGAPGWRHTPRSQGTGSRTRRG